MTTIYVSTEQANAINDAIKIMRSDGWHIEGIQVTIPDNGSGCFVNLTEKDYSYKFLFQLGMKAGYILGTLEKIDGFTPSELAAQRNSLLLALKTIAEWKLPETGKFWDKGEKHPISYQALYGTVSARNYIKSLAKDAINKTKK